MFLNFVVPFVLLGIRRLRTIAGATVASVSVLIGMWIERFIIVVPTLANPRLPVGIRFLHAHVGRSRDHRRHLCRHGYAVHDFREAVPDHRRVGV